MTMASLYSDIRKHHLKTWRIWYAMNQRCDPEWSKRYLKTHGTHWDICDEWSREESGEQGFINFFDCVGDLEHVSELHRIDTSKAYAPDNILKGDTVSRAQHSNYYNTAKARGMRKAEARGIPRWCYYKRLHRGWSIVKAYTTPYAYVRGKR